MEDNGDHGSQVLHVLLGKTETNGGAEINLNLLSRTVRHFKPNPGIRGQNSLKTDVTLLREYVYANFFTCKQTLRVSANFTRVTLTRVPNMKRNVEKRGPDEKYNKSLAI